MDRTKILGLLHSYQTQYSTEKSMVIDTIKFVELNPMCFLRTLESGHLTGSAWIVNEGRTHTCLINHIKLNRWFQPGGHCDGETDVLKVALKETLEETCISAKPISNHIYDVDIHTIPARKGVAEHLHYDIRFLLEAQIQNTDFSSSEVKQVAWVPLSRVKELTEDTSILRMIEKTKDLNL